MPNQRDPNKRQLTIAVDKKVLERIEAACKELGINRTDFLRLAAEKELKEQEAQKRKK